MTYFESSWTGMTQREKFKNGWCTLLKKVRTREEGGQTCEWSAGPCAWSRPSLRSMLPRRKMNHPQAAGENHAQECATLAPGAPPLGEDESPGDEIDA